MLFDVMLLKQTDDYIARPAFWPDLVARGTTAQEALEGVRALLQDTLQHTQWLKVEVDAPHTPPVNPWLDKAGMFVTDPTWDSFLEALATQRQPFAVEADLESP